MSEIDSKSAFGPLRLNESIQWNSPTNLGLTLRGRGNRHRDISLEDAGQEMVKVFEKDDARRRMTPSYEMNLRMLDLHLDQLIPRDPDPELFNDHGHLQDRELKAWRERPKVEPERPRVLGYLGVESLT
jgi:hypothetical protein